MNKSSYAFSLLILIIIVFSSSMLAQTGMRLNIMPEGLGFSNQLEYSYDIDLKREILENWLNLDYSKGIFSTGLRYSIFQPNDPDPSISSRARGNLADDDRAASGTVVATRWQPDHVSYRTPVWQ